MAQDTDMIAMIADVFERRGAELYLGEAVTLSDHMLQTAALAQAEGASDALVAAALLHDIGHFTGAFDTGIVDDTVDHQHELAGARVLAAHFPPLVADCVRLHVAAKRYLCAVEPEYHARLSVASRHSLGLQGGPMDDDQCARFRREPFHEAAVRVRRWDDGGKTTGLAPLSFAGFRPLLQSVLVTQQM